MKKLFFLIILTCIPYIMFAWNNTSLRGFSSPNDAIISTNSACKQRFSDWWNKINHSYEQVEFTGSGKYNSAYGFRKYWNYLYFIVKSGETFDDNSMTFTSSKSTLIIYNCKNKKIHKQISIKNEIGHYINKPVYKNNDYIIFQAWAPEATSIDYSLINLKTWKIILVSSLPWMKKWTGFDIPLYGIKKIIIKNETLMIWTDNHGTFSFALDTFN